MNKKLSIMSLLIAILLIITITIGTSYSLWTTSVNQVSVNTIDVGCFRISFNDRNIAGSGDISLANAYPMKNEAGKVLMPYRFNIENQCSVAASYNVNLETLTTSTMDESKLNVYFNDSVIKSYIPNVINGLSDDAKNGMNLIRGYLPAGENITYSLRVWIDYDVTVDTPNVQGKTWNGRIAVNSEATISKPTYLGFNISNNNVIYDIDTRSSKTVSTLSCYYGDKNTQATAGTAVGTTKCQYPLTAEYIKYTVTYTDGTSDTSYVKAIKKEVNDYKQCPNCVFTNTVAKHFFFDEEHVSEYPYEAEDKSTTISSENYTSDYESLSSKVFLGLKLKENNIVDYAYVCTNLNVDLFCIPAGIKTENDALNYFEPFISYICPDENNCDYTYDYDTYLTVTSDSDPNIRFYIEAWATEFKYGGYNAYSTWDDPNDSLAAAMERY